MSRSKDQLRPSSQLTAPLNPDIIVRASETATRQPSTEVDLGTMKIAFRAAQGGRAVEVIRLETNPRSREFVLLQSSFQITEILVRRIDRERWYSVRMSAVGSADTDARIRIKMYPGEWEFNRCEDESILIWKSILKW